MLYGFTVPHPSNMADVQEWKTNEGFEIGVGLRPKYEASWKVEERSYHSLTYKQSL